MLHLVNAEEFELDSKKLKIMYGAGKFFSSQTYVKFVIFNTTTIIFKVSSIYTMY